MKRFWNKLTNFLTTKPLNDMESKNTGAAFLTIDNVNNVIYDKRDCKYYYKDGDEKHTLNPHSMIIRGSIHNPNAPIVYIDSNDKKMRNGTNGVHPVRRWYADTHHERYAHSREITVGRWFALSEERKRFANR